MAPTLESWMTYIDREVRAICSDRGWGHQIRRKSSARHKPVSHSAAADYEWKLIPDASGHLPESPPGDFEGTYYVLSLDEPGSRFLLQHDTHHCGIMGPHWFHETFTAIRFEGTPGAPPVGGRPEVESVPLPGGWLKGHLMVLTKRFEPNVFSVT